MPSTNPQWIVLFEVAAAMVLGGIIGAERETAAKPAGFRTHMLVSGAAALLVGITHALTFQYVDPRNAAFIRSDPVRVIEAIITGISFLGMGTIFRKQGSSHVQGLTTAAAILMSAAVGIAVATQQFIIACGATLLTVGVLRGLRVFESPPPDAKHQ